MDSQHKVSIGIPIYGVEKYIERCAISLFEQTYQNIEYIFVNDCTLDKSIDILKEIIEKYPKRKKETRIIHHEKNRGLAAARNTAVKHSSGEFIIWVDSDDYIENNAIELLINKQKEKDSDIVSFDSKVHLKKYFKIWQYADFNSSKEMTIQLISRKSIISIWGRLIRLSLYKDYNIRAREGVNMGEDYSVIPILVYYAKEVDNLHIPLYHYDCTNQSSYTYSFSEEKGFQTWSAYEILEAFFKNKDTEYDKALDIAKIRIIVRQIIDCSKKGDHKQFYIFLRDKLKTIKKERWHELSLPIRIVLYLPNIKIIKIYVLIVGCIKHIFEATMAQKKQTRKIIK